MTGGPFGWNEHQWKMCQHIAEHGYETPAHLVKLARGDVTSLLDLYDQGVLRAQFDEPLDRGRLYDAVRTNDRDLCVTFEEIGSEWERSVCQPVRAALKRLDAGQHKTVGDFLAYHPPYGPYGDLEEMLPKMVHAGMVEVYDGSRPVAGDALYCARTRRETKDWPMRLTGVGRSFIGEDRR